MIELLFNIFMEIFMLNRLKKSGEGGAVLCTFFYLFLRNRFGSEVV